MHCLIYSGSLLNLEKGVSLFLRGLQGAKGDKDSSDGTSLVLPGRKLNFEMEEKTLQSMSHQALGAHSN